MTILLGVDTGGTYTDAVLVRNETDVIASAKSLTTRSDLAVGIGKAIKEVKGLNDKVTKKTAVSNPMDVIEKLIERALKTNDSNDIDLIDEFWHDNGFGFLDFSDFVKHMF